MEKEEILKKIDKEIKYQEKLLSFYKPHDTHPEEIIKYTKLITCRNQLKEGVETKKKEVTNIFLNYLEYIIDFLFES